MTKDIAALCRELYGAQPGNECYDALSSIMEQYASTINAPSSGGRFPLSAKDIMLITYGNQFQGTEPALHYLHRFLEEDLQHEICGVHILPFNPYSSDEGFSAINFLKIAPSLGSWEDISTISNSFLFMADLVVNHCSSQSEWFKRFLKNEAPYHRYFITADPTTDLSAVFRPRTSPLLHRFETDTGSRHVWSTFSADQVDLNYEYPPLLQEMINVLLFYIQQGARIIRLDAIAYLWKEIGTSSIHHPHTHHVVQLMRAITNVVAPGVLLLTETNVPHADNISYFGDGANEAQMVYNFSLPPLTLDALIRGDASHLTSWAATLDPPPQCAFFNFLASHDGIGVLPAAGYLNAEEQQQLIEVVQERGGMVSYKNTPQGKIPYELNINYLSAIADKKMGIQSRSQSFLTAQAIMLSLAGVPAPYVHSVVGSENWTQWKEGESGKRSINRERFRYQDIHQKLQEEGSLRNLIFQGYRRLIRARAAEPLFAPDMPQKILDCSPKVLALIRGAQPTGAKLLCLHNVSHQPASLSLSAADIGPWQRGNDLISGGSVTPNELQSLQLQPYQSLWLKLE